MMVLRQSVRVSIHGDHRGELSPEAVGWFDGRTPSKYLRVLSIIIRSMAVDGTPDFISQGMTAWLSHS